MLEQRQGERNSRWVDPFLGNSQSQLPHAEGVAATWWRAKPPVGNTHPGAVCPFGMVSACAYSGAYVTGYGRYGVSLTGDPPPVVFERHEALGIAHFQQSGTGRIRVYYNYLLTTPLTGKGLEGLGQRCALSDERAWPGYYSARFEEKNVFCEVTCTQRSAVHRYEFPENVRGKVAIDLSAGGLLVDDMRSYPQEGRVGLEGPSSAEGMVVMRMMKLMMMMELMKTRLVVKLMMMISLLLLYIPELILFSYWIDVDWC